MLFGGGAPNGGFFNSARRKSAAEIMGGRSIASAKPDAGPAGGSEIVATPQQQAQSAALEQLLGTQGMVPPHALPQRNARPLPMLQGAETAPGHWTVEGFDQQRQAAQAELPRMALGGPLGHSMRQPFDYEGALARMVGEKPKVKDWQKIAAIVGDALVMNGGGQPFAMKSLMAPLDAYRERSLDAAKTMLGWQHSDWQNQNEADLRASAPFSSGRDRVMYDPTTGQSQVIYDGKDDFENYAATMGLEPGSEDYFNAVEDYVLRSNGPSAYDRDVALDDHRTGNDASLERLRYGNRVGLEGIRQGNRRGMVDYRNQHPAPARPRASSGSPRQSIVTVSTPAEAAKLKPGTHYRGPDGVVRER